MYSQNDWRDYLEHSWGNKPEQKAKEKAYNKKYYQEHKDKWIQYAKNPGSAAEDAASYVYGKAKNAVTDAYNSYKNEEARREAENEYYTTENGSLIPKDWGAPGPGKNSIDIPDGLVTLDYNPDDYVEERSRSGGAAVPERLKTESEKAEEKAKAEAKRQRKEKINDRIVSAGESFLSDLLHIPVKLR